VLNLDTSTPFGARVERRLQEDIVVWLTTVGGAQTPQPSPVWFLWDGETILIYSQPTTPKLRNIERTPRVALNFDGDGDGGDIIVLTGDARIATDQPPADQVPAYVAKYQDGIRGLGMSPKQFAQGYAVAIRVTPTTLRGH